MDFAALVHAAVQMGRAEVKTAGYEPDMEKACLDGFARCASLHSIEDFEGELRRCETEEAKLRRRMSGYIDCVTKQFVMPDLTPEEMERVSRAYWVQRRFTAQIEHVYKLVCFAAVYNNWPGAERLRAKGVSARAGMQYARVVGVKTFGG